jgi:hypothetical protein
VTCQIERSKAAQSDMLLHFTKPAKPAQTTLDITDLSSLEILQLAASVFGVSCD